MTKKRKKPAKKKAVAKTAVDLTTGEILSEPKAKPKRGTGRCRKGKATKGRNKRGRKPSVDYKRAKLLWTTTLGMTYKEAAEEVGAHPDTIAARGRKEDWPAIRAALTAKLVQEGLQEGLEKRKVGAAALTTLEYQESLSIISMLQSMRRQAMVVDPKTGELRCTWTPKKAYEYTKTFSGACGIGRRALGMPTQIKATPEEAKKAGTILTGEFDLKSLNDDEAWLFREMLQKVMPDEPDDGEK